MGQISLENKLILHDMVYKKLWENFRIPRGYNKSLVTLPFRIRIEAMKRTNYILAAIDDKLW